MHTKLDAFEPVEMLPGLTRRYLGHGESMSAVEFVIQEGVKIPPHTHPHEQGGYIAKGTGKMRIGDSWFIVSERDSYFIPAEVEHELIADDEIIAVDFFSPVREDYLP